MDMTILSYSVAKWALIYNFVLFAVWLIMVKREGGEVSEVYLIIMALFAARWYGVHMGMVARELRNVDNRISAYYDFMSGLWWDTRLVPESIVFIFLAYVLTRRFIRSYFFSNPRYRSKNGRRKTDK